MSWNATRVKTGIWTYTLTTHLIGSCCYGWWCVWWVKSYLQIWDQQCLHLFFPQFFVFFLASCIFSGFSGFFFGFFFSETKKPVLKKKLNFFIILKNCPSLDQSFIILLLPKGTLPVRKLLMNSTLLLIVSDKCNIMKILVYYLINSIIWVC